MRRELDRLVDPMEYDTWIWRQDIFNRALQSLAYPDVERILDSLQHGAEEQLRQVFLVAEDLHQFIDSAPVKGVKDAVATSLPHSGRADHGNSTISLARAWCIASGTPQEVGVVNVTNPIVQVFTQGFADELGQLLPPGYTFGEVTRDLSTPASVGVGPHAEILGARELSERGCVVGVVATSRRGCEICIPEITRSYPWLLHLNPLVPPQRL